MLDLDRAVLNEAIGLQAQGYFTPWNAASGKPSPAGAGTAKVGVIGLDTPDYHYAIDKVLRPELGQLGHAPAGADVVYLDYPQRTSDLSSLSAAAANAIVKFRQHGVEHVLIVDATGTLTLEFLNQAESQHYYPRYGWNSQNAAQALVGPGDVPKDQLTGSMGIGYMPAIDLTPGDNPDNGKYSNPQRRTCLALMKAKGFSFSDANSKAVALLLCNTVWFFQHVLQSAAKPLSQATFVDAVNHFGTSFNSATTFGTYFGPAQHDGGANYYHYVWNQGCGCMRYNGGLHKAIGEGER
jgi:hypothetical protein